MILRRSNTRFSLRLVTLKSKIIASQGIVSCHHMNRKSKVGIRGINTYFLRQSPMKSLHSRYQVQRLTNQRANSSLTGILTRRNTFCNCTSSQDRQKLINHHQLLLGLCLMGMGFLVLHRGHRGKLPHPRHKFRRPRLMLPLLHLWECPLGFLHHLLGVFNLRRLRHQWQMVRGQ